MRGIALVIVVLAVACGGTTRSTGRSQDVLAALAKEIDPGPQAPLWPQVSADVRTEIEGRVPENLAGTARLEAAHVRLANWRVEFSTTEPGELTAKLERAFEGVYLAEPLALAGTVDDTVLGARTLLWDFYSTFATSSAMLDALATSWNVGDARFARALAVAKQLSKGGLAMRDHLAAELLRTPPAGASATLEDIVSQNAVRRRRDGDLRGAAALYAEIVRRHPAPVTADEWITVARAQIGMGETADDAIARARAVAPRGDDAAARLVRASLRSLARDRGALVRLAGLGSDTAARLARFDALLELGRLAEARTTLDELARDRPRDARVRARRVQLRLWEGDISPSSSRDCAATTSPIATPSTGRPGSAPPAWRSRSPRPARRSTRSPRRRVNTRASSPDAPRRSGSSSTASPGCSRVPTTRRSSS